MTEKPDKSTRAEDEALAPYFRAARDAAPAPSQAFVERALADAAAEAERTRHKGGGDGVVQASDRFQRFRRSRPVAWQLVAAAGGLAAGLVGFWIGLEPPAAVQALEAALLGDPFSLDINDQLAGLDELLVEG